MAFQGDSIFWVEVGKIVPNPFQPRKEFNKERLTELAESIRMYGILQPLTVTRKEIQEESGAFHTEYELIAGERRLRAAKLAGLEQVPVIIRSGEDTEQEKLELAIIENLQREDLNAVDRALAFKQLAEVFKLSHSQVGKKVGRSRMYVSNTIRLLSLPEDILESLAQGDLSEGHARTLLMLKDRPEEQHVVYREILLKKLSVREVERIARKIATDKVRKKKWTNTDAHLIEIEREFTNTLGTRVQIAKTDFGGKLTIDYFSEEDLDKLLQMVKSQAQTAKIGTSSPQTPQERAEPLMHDMSVEATTLAKVAAATPLEVVAEEHISSVAASQTHTETENNHDLSPQQADVMPEIEQSVEETPVSTHTVPSDISPVAKDVADRAEEEEHGVTHTPIVEHTQSNEQNSPVYTAPTPNEAREVLNTYQNEQIQKDTDTHTAQGADLSEAITPAPAVNDAIPSSPLPTEVPPVPDVPEPTQTQEEYNEEDDDLYSIRNFSL